jgi:seryl-tRNA synthetase
VPVRARHPLSLRRRSLQVLKGKAMGNISPFLSKPSEWVEQLAEIQAERKKLEDREDNLKSKLKLHMQEQGVETVTGEKHEFKRSTSERTDLSQKAIAATFGEKFLDELIVKLPKAKSETYRLVERKDDPKVKEIVDHFSAKAPEISATKPTESVDPDTCQGDGIDPCLGASCPVCCGTLKYSLAKSKLTTRKPFPR